MLYSVSVLVIQECQRSLQQKSTIKRNDDIPHDGKKKKQKQNKCVYYKLEVARDETHFDYGRKRENVVDR